MPIRAPGLGTGRSLSPSQTPASRLGVGPGDGPDSSCLTRDSRTVTLALSLGQLTPSRTYTVTQAPSHKSQTATARPDAATNPALPGRRQVVTAEGDALLEFEPGSRHLYCRARDSFNFKILPGLWLEVCISDST